MGAPYIYDVSRLRVKSSINCRLGCISVNYKAAQEHRYNRETITVREKGKGTQKMYSNVKK